MKHRYTTFLSLLLPLVLAAQQNHPLALPEHMDGKHQGVPSAVKKPVGAPKAATYYSETFDSNLNGWTVNTPVGSLDWAWTDVGPGPTSSTYPVPVLNTSTPSGWAIIDDDYLGIAGQATNSWLVSPVIDLSSAPTNLKLEFDQYFQEFQADSCFVGITTDGVTWNEVEVNAGVGRDGRPNPELMDLDISAWVAGNPSTVQIRFRYVSVWDYGWQVDNIAITDLPANDMAILNAFKTSFNFASTGLENIDYSVYPTSQLRPMLLYAKVKNKGSLAQTGVNLKVDVITSLPEFNGVSSYIDMTPTQEDSLAVEGFTPTNTPGTWTVDFSLEQNEIDDVPANNTTSQTFEVSTCIWAQDDGVCNQTQGQGADHLGEPMELGNFFDVVANGEMNGIHVALHENSTPGTLIYGIIYDSNLDFVDQTDDYEIQSYDLNPLGGGSFIALPFASPVPITAGEAYCVMVGNYGGSDEVVYCTSGISVPQVSILRYPSTVEDFYVTKTPMVRAILDAGCVVGVHELSRSNTAVVAWPNPFNEVTALRFELANSSSVSVELRDVTGRIVSSENLGLLATGQQHYSVEGGALAEGAYIWTVTIDGSRHSGTIVRSSH